MNNLLNIYSDGFELTDTGEVVPVPEGGMRKLLEAPIPGHDSENIEDRVSAAIIKFRRHRSSLEDRRDAIRDLADVLEFLRPRFVSGRSKPATEERFKTSHFERRVRPVEYAPMKGGTADGEPDQSDCNSFDRHTIQPWMVQETHRTGARA